MSAGSTIKGLSRRSTISNPDPDSDHHSSDHASTPDSTHKSILHDSEDSDPDDLESVSSHIPKPLLEDEGAQDKVERASEMRFSFSKDDEIRLLTSPLMKDMRSNSISTPTVPIIHSEEEEEGSEPDTERMSTAAPSLMAKEDEESITAKSRKSTKTAREMSPSEFYAEIKTLPTSRSKPHPAQVEATDEQNLKREKVENSVAKVSTSSLTKDDESSKLRSVRSSLPRREDASSGATTSYVCTNGGMVFAYKRPSSSEIDGSMITEGDGHESPAGKKKFEKPKKKLSSSSNPGDPAHHSPRNQRADCVDQSGESNHVSGRFSPRRMAKNLRFTLKEGGKKTKVTLSSLRMRKAKLRESILPDKPIDVKRIECAGRKLSGSLECLIDAVKKEDFSEVDPFAGEFSRSVSMLNVSIDENSKEDPFPSEPNIGRSISVTSDRSLRTESHTSNESLQRLGEEDYDSDDPPVVLRRLKRSSMHGLYDPQEYHHAPPPPLPDEISDSKKLEYRHSLKTIKEEKPSRFTRHVRNKSDTSMLPPFRPPSGSKSPSTPKHHQNSSFNLFQSLQEHLKSTISMPNVFRRERHSRPIVSELAPPEISTDTDPITLLVQYQFLSLRCCPGVRSRPELRALLLSAPHNSEGQNYKLSFEREPN